MEDDKLLARYAHDGSEAAFGQLVARHLTLVYSTCLRETGSPSQAEDAAQVVFLLLARKARSLRAGPSLAGWLYKAARFVAKDVRKQEARRRLREEVVMQEVRHGQEPANQEWDRIEPLLNDALSALKPAECEAILLRFIEGHSLTETGAALGLSEDAARMRISRAVEKMRRYLIANGVSVTGLVLTGLLTSEAARPVPANAASVITQGTLQALSFGPTANVLLISKGVYQTMKIIKVKIAAFAAVLVVGGAALTPLVHALSPHQTTLQISAAPTALMKPSNVPLIPDYPAPSSEIVTTDNTNNVLIIGVDFVDVTSAAYKKATKVVARGLNDDALLLDALVKQGAKDIKMPKVQTGEGVQATSHLVTNVPFTITEKGQTQHNFMDLDSFVQITPHSNSDGTIAVTLQVQRATLISNGPPPRSATGTISKTITFRDGQTLILGGRGTGATPTALTYHLIFMNVRRLKLSHR